MGLRTWIIKKLTKPEDLECVATGQTSITWTNRNNAVENIQWIFYKNILTGKRSYEYYSHGSCRLQKSHEHWIGAAKKYVATGILPNWAEAVDFEMMKK